MSLSATQHKLAAALQKIETYPQCDAESMFKTKYNMRRLLAAIPMEDPTTGTYNYSVILYRDSEWTTLRKNLVANTATNITAGQPLIVPGPPWVPPANPGRPTATGYARQDTWRWKQEMYKEYEDVLAWSRDAILKAFSNKKLLICKENALGNLTHHHSLDLIFYLRKTRSNQRQIDSLIEKAKKDLQVEYDPSEEFTIYFALLEEAR